MFTCAGWKRPGSLRPRPYIVVASSDARSLVPTGATRRQHPLPPCNLQFLAQLALEYCAANDSNTEGLATFGEEWGRRVARELPAGPKGPLPLAAAVEVAAAALRGLGCAARIENGGGRGLALIEGSCLFSPLSSSHAPVVCQVHQALIRGMLLELTGSNGFRLDHVASLALGHRTCRTQIIPSAS